ncbi:MAG TPA: amidohydrolase family protein [Acidimicrobiales bacterium]|nr:amidohydrolase family protein [Acidimicrobiales bacterium]
MAGIGRFSRRLRDRPDDLLPLPPGPVSNGEFVPAPPTAKDRAVGALIREDIDAAVHRTGVDRRRFLQGAGAVAATLAAFEFAGCAASPVSHPHAGSARGKGGRFAVPPPEDTAACQQALTGSEFIFDVHTHHVIPTGPWVDDSPDTTSLVLSMLPAGCTDADQLDCVDRANYLHDIFLASDTTVAMLTDVPNSGPSNAPIPFPEALRTQQITAGLTGGGASRLLVENIIAPNVGPVSATLQEMSSAVSTGPPAAFKVYTAWSPTGQGYSLEDPTIGLPTVQQAHDLGVKVFVAHKGLPLVNFDPAFNHPDDIVAVSRQFPDMQFVVYHAAWDPSHVEGPYDPDATIGIDTMLAALDRHNVPPNDNVWVDIATMWRQLLTDPDQAAHALGKLLARVGTQRVLWGTDAIWYGSPEPQIMAMQTFEITPEFQETYSYPALTTEVKAGLFGLNAATLFGVDATAMRCGLTQDPLTANISEAAALRHEGALPSAWQTHGPTTRREVLDWLGSSATRWVPF